MAVDETSLSIPGKPRPWIMAHRGASDHAPENTLAAFALALEHGADLIETDLWVCADGELMCHHDRTLERMTGDRRDITTLTAAEIGRLRVRDDPGGYADQRVPTLAAVLDAVPAEVPVMLELKDPRLREANMASRLGAVVGERARKRGAAVISEDMALVRAAAEHCPGLVTGYISKRNPLPMGPTELLGPYWPLLFLNPLYVRMAHARGRRVCPLDPGLHGRLHRYLAMDVDTVLTNDPAATRTRIEALRGATRRDKTA